MSQTGTTETVATANEAVETFAKRWDKRGKLIVRASDDQAAFSTFVGETFDDTNPYKDWASDAATIMGEGLTLIMVRSDDDAENRLVAAPSKDVAFSDEVIRDALYRMLLNKWANIAAKADAAKDMFMTVNGIFKPRFDLEAFKHSARDVVKFLHSKGLHGITVPTLRTALMNAANAQANFPQMKEEQWSIIFAIFFKNAEEASLDTSVLKHWQNTRNNMTDAGVELGFGEDEFAKFMTEEEEGDASDAAA